ncbi:MAG TPA: radical SAM family heme chaperone HemW [Thermomicrobiales bacterium]|nr:radical SAM family heme chaperone HemW [Thermomicrobiales bacterium]
MTAPARLGDPLGIYLHIPFCAHICPYCDFNTYAGQDDLIPRYVTAMEREITRQGEMLGHRAAATVFLGGGTPSLLTGDQVGRLVQSCRDAFDLVPDAEVTLEANPNSLDVAACDGLLQAGVNRLSLGVQTRDRRGLRVLGRQHEAADAFAAFQSARQAGFNNLSLDLIFGWPGQTPEGWRQDLETVLSWGGSPEHLSLYHLIVEPGTPMADAVTRGILHPPDDDASADLYELAIELLADAGYEHYEVANWARSPDLQSRHNLIYWRNGEWAGIGAGAHGQTEGRREMQHLLPKAFIEAVEHGEAPISNVESVSSENARGETMMLGLRLLREGISPDAFAARHGDALDAFYGATIEELSGLGLLEASPERVRLTHRGLMVANEVCGRFL